MNRTSSSFNSELHHVNLLGPYKLPGPWAESSGINTNLARARSNFNYKKMFCITVLLGILLVDIYVENCEEHYALAHPYLYVFLLPRNIDRFFKFK